MIINNTNELCTFIKKIKLCNNRCPECMFFNRFIKIKGELEAMCDHDWYYDVEGRESVQGDIITRKCGMPDCKAVHRIAVQSIDREKLNALFED